VWLATEKTTCVPSHALSPVRNTRTVAARTQARKLAKHMPGGSKDSQKTAQDRQKDGWTKRTTGVHLRAPVQVPTKRVRKLLVRTG
jgi:hypothetical protein